jgi:hypothetical protein
MEGPKYDKDKVGGTEANRQGANSEDSSGLAQISRKSVGSGQESRRCEARPSSRSSDQEQPGGTIPQEAEHRIRSRSGPRVTTLEDIDDLDTQLTQAFRVSDPAKIWTLVRDLLKLTRSLVQEAAETRFQVNFGSERCGSCDGLKAGPGVVATCFQLRKCFYRNIRSDDTSKKQKAVLDSFRTISKGRS